MWSLISKWWKKLKAVLFYHDIEIKEFVGSCPHVSYLSGKVEDFYKQLHEEKLKEAEKELYKQANNEAKERSSKKQNTK